MVLTATRIESPEALRALADSLKQAAAGKTVVCVCLGTGCLANGAAELFTSLQGAVRELGLEDRVDVHRTGCHGFCERGPVVVVRPEGVFYNAVQPADAAEIVNKTARSGELVERLLYQWDSSRAVHEEDVPFYKNQLRVALRLNGHIDPLDIGDYIREDGYSALCVALFKFTPEQIVEQVTASGLRGRGGGGFPTGRKWASCRQAHGEPKYVICNGDEGDPGAFMDRSIMEGNPHSVLEGMVIGAYAIGCRQGYIYVRKEYPLAVEHAAQGH